MKILKLSNGVTLHYLYKSVHITRISILLLFVMIFQLKTENLSSQEIVNLSFKNTTIESVLDKIERETGYTFLFIDKTVDVNRHVDVNLENREINDVLKMLFHGTNVHYSIIDKQIILSDNKINRPADIQQSRIITGVVTDPQDKPIIGANVIEKGTTNGTITDVNGQFSIEVPAGKVLLVSYVGFINQEIATGNRTNIMITLVESIHDLDEVVVIGYGTIRKKDLTGSVGSVKSAELMQRPATNLSQSLAGKIAGVNVSTNSGRPGGNPIIRIRGYSSIQATNEPLYIVDGIVSNLSSVNPDDIESIDVLKDASSTAIYGTRGSNGVVVVTTKRGNNESRVNYNTYLSFNKMARKIDLLNSSEFLYIEEQAYINAKKFDPVGFADGKYMDPIEKRKRYLPGNPYGNRALFTLDANGVAQPIYDVDWQDTPTRTSLSQMHNLSWTGSYDKTNLGFFLGLTDDQGIIKESAYKRYSGRVTADRIISPWLKLGGTLSYSMIKERRVDTRQGYNNVPRMMVEMVPFIPYKYEDGSYGYRSHYLGLEAGDNPLAQIQENITPYNSDIVNGNAYAKITLIKGLDFTSTFGVDRVLSQIPYFNSTKSDIVGGLGVNEASMENSESTQWQWSNLINYLDVFNEVHSLNVLLGVEHQGYEYFRSKAVVGNVSDDYYKWYNLGAGSTLKAPSSSYNEDKMESYFARVNYSFRDRYLFTITGRVDGSSKFGDDNKYAFFPSAAIGWRISEEDFLSNNPLISNLKVRTSYGFTGNSGIGAYNSMANLNTNAYPIGGGRQSGIGVGSLSNPLLRWEKTGQFDVGFDLGLFNQRMSLSADYYIKKTTDLLMPAPVPSSSGYSSMTRNIGSMKNQGFELTLNTVNIQTNDIMWTTSFNISTLKNKITALGEKNEDIIQGPNNLTILRVGESVGSLFGYICDGIWGTSETEEAAKFGKLPGDAKIRDIVADGKINESDRVIIGKGIPDFYGTFSNSLKYKNVDFLLELQFCYGNDVYMDHFGTAVVRQGLANSYAMVLDAWTPDNQNSTLEQWRPASAGYTSLKDTRRLKDGSFIRGKNLSVGYNLPVKVCKRLKIKDLRLSLSAQNLFLITKYPGYDPEVTTYSEAFAQGIVASDYPKAKTYTIGLNVSF